MQKRRKIAKHTKTSDKFVCSFGSYILKRLISRPFRNQSNAKNATNWYQTFRKQHLIWTKEATQSINKRTIPYIFWPIEAAKNSSISKTSTKKQQKIAKHAETSNNFFFHLAIIFWNALFQNPPGVNNTPKTLRIDSKPLGNSSRLIQSDQTTSQSINKCTISYIFSQISFQKQQH